MKRRAFNWLFTAAMVMLPVVAEAHMEAEIRWTRHGVPHVTAKDYAGLGYGYGYAVARDRLCVLADRMVTLRGERSRWYGADGAAAVGFLPTTNIEADIFHRIHLSEEAVTAALDGLDPRTRDLARGYAAGFNDYVAGEGREAATTCDGPIYKMTDADIARTMMAIGTIWKAFQVAPFGSASVWNADAAVKRGADQNVSMLPPSQLPPGIGSNAWAFGGDLTGGGAIVLANPHSRWDSDQWLQLHQLHLTIPGEIDVAGADFVGLPMPVIGFNKDLAWTILAPSTVSFYVLQSMAVKEDPVPTYSVDDIEKPLAIKSIEIEVRDDDGTIRKAAFPFAWSDLGPLYRLPEAPGRPAGWYAVTDAGAGDARGLDQLLAVARSSDIATFAKVTAEHRGIGAHFVGGDRYGDAVYVEAGPLLGVTDDALASCRVPGAAATVLDGSRSECWLRDDEGRPRLAGLDEQPSMLTRSVVQNVNNSYHRSVPDKAGTAYSVLLGSADRFPTRLPMSEQRVAEIVSDGRADADEILSLVYDNRNFAAETALDEILTACGEPGSADACAILRAWDRRNDSESRGALLFTELWARLVKRGLFNPSTCQPISAPDLAARIVDTLSETLQNIRALGLRGDEPWGQMLARDTPEGRIPLHGGNDSEGILNALQGGPLTADGYGDANSGTAYLQLVSWENGRPVARVVLAHGQSPDPESAHYGDQIDFYRAKRLVRFPFTEKEIRRDPEYRIERVSDD